MKQIMISAAALAAIFLAAPAAYADGNGRACPPGLAKKSPACVPPGQAKKGGDRRDWYRGDRLEGDYYRIYDRYRYRLPPLREGEAYYRIGDQIVKVDRDTLEVIGLIGLVDSLIN